MIIPAGAVAAVAVPPNIDPVGIRVQRVRKNRGKNFPLNNDGMPDLAAVRAMFSPAQQAAADQYTAEYNAHVATLPTNPNIIDESGVGDPSGNAHRPLTGAAGDIGTMAMAYATFFSPFGPRSFQRLKEIGLSCSSKDPTGEALMDMQEMFTKEAKSTENGVDVVRLVDRQLINGFSNASGSFLWVVNTLEGRPLFLNYDLLKRLYRPGDSEYDNVAESLESRQKHLWLFKDWLAVCTFHQLSLRNFMYVAGETSPYYYLVESECLGALAGVGGIGDISSIGARINNNWVCYAPVGMGASMMDVPYGPLHPPSDPFQLVDDNGNLVANGQYFFLELKMRGGTDAVSLKGRCAFAGSCVTDEVVHAAAYCGTQLDQTKFMQDLDQLADGALMPGTTIVKGCTSRFVARMAAFHDLSPIEKMRLLISSGYNNCIEIQPPFNDGRVVVARHGPVVTGLIEIRRGDNFFDRIFDGNGNSPFDTAILMLSVRFQITGIEERNFKNFLRDVLVELERNGDGQGSGYELQFEMVRMDNTERRYRNLPTEYKKALLKEYLKERLKNWDQPAAQAAAAPAAPANAN